MFIYLFVYTNNSKTLDDFTKLLNKINDTRKTKIKFFFTQNQTKKQSKTFTVLKSPHVNKKAQEHFNLLKYKKKITLCSFKLNKLLIILKKNQQNLLSDMHIKIKVRLANFDTNKDLLDPDIFILNNSKSILKSNSNTFLKVADGFGEFLLKKGYYSRLQNLKKFR